MSLLTATIFPASYQEEVVVLEDNIIMFVFIAMKYACNSFDRTLAMNYACNSFDRNGHSITIGWGELKTKPMDTSVKKTKRISHRLFSVDVNGSYFKLQSKDCRSIDRVLMCHGVCVCFGQCILFKGFVRYRFLKKKCWNFWKAFNCNRF